MPLSALSNRYVTPVSFAVATLAMLLSCAAYPQATNPFQDAFNKAKQQLQNPNTRQGQPSAQGAPSQTSSTAAANNTPFTPPAGTKVESALLAAQEPGAQFSVSPHGIHMATLSHSGSRVVMVYDGVPGPKFDQIFAPQGMSLAGVVFSPDGNRYAYCGQIGNEFIVMVDGKEFYRDSKVSAQGVINHNSCTAMNFSSNSKHFYFLSYIRVDPRSATDGISFIWDGRADPPNGNGDYRTYAFSPDGDHVAYVWMGLIHDTTQKLIIDGKPASYLAGGPQWSADSQHLFSTVRTGGAQPEVDLLLDGKPYLKGADVRLIIPPAGDRTLAIVTRNAGAVNSYFLAMDGRPVSGSEHTGPGGPQANGVTFSADGKHYAVAYAAANGRVSVFADGKKGLEYGRLDPFGTYESKVQGTFFMFTKDPANVVYLADSSTTPQFLVIGAQESDEIRMAGEVAVAPVGNHVLVSGLNGGQSKVLLDGKALPLPPANRAFQLSFSPDGAHYAFALQEHDGIVIFVDGKQYAPNIAVEADGRAFVFSADSKHLAFFCRPANPAAGNDVGVCLDGKYLSMGPSALANLTFSADSNHLYWSRQMGPSVRVFADGKPVLESGMPATSGFTKATWQPSGASGLLVFAQDNEGFKRFSITPATATSLGTMAGSR